MKRRVLLVCQRGNNVPFVFEAAARNGIELIVAYSPDEKAPIHMPAVVSALELPVFDEPQRALQLIETWARDNPIDGIVTQREEAIVWTALAAERLGLPGIGIDAALAARSKVEMRRRFAASGLNSPWFIEIHYAEEIDLVGDVRFPAVVKPASAYGSAGVMLVRDRTQMRAAAKTIDAMNVAEFARFSKHPDAAYHGILIEEFIDGPEYVAECFARDGRQYVLSVGYKGNPLGPFFEESVYLAPPVADPGLVAAIVSEAKNGMTALGLVNGPGHCELRIGPDGRPYILEIGARLGGSGISHAVVEMSTDLDYAGLQYDFLTNASRLRAIPEDPAPARTASNYIIPLGGSGTLVGIHGLEAMKSHPDFRRLLRFMPDGKVVAPYPRFDGYVGFILSQHADPQAGLAFHRWLDEIVHPVWN
jgi:biotin carboxylase